MIKNVKRTSRERALNVNVALIVAIVALSPAASVTEGTVKEEVKQMSLEELQAERLRRELAVIEYEDKAAEKAAELKAEAERLKEEARLAEEARVNRVRIPMQYDGWYVTSEWGNRCGVEGVYGGCLHHSGIDFGNGPATGWKAFPAAKGVVTLATQYGGPLSGCGVYVLVYHPQFDQTTAYCHLAEGSILVSEGQEVDPDTPLGEVGTTGMSNGIHLHFGVYQGSEVVGSEVGNIDPRGWFASHGISI